MHTAQHCNTVSTYRDVVLTQLMLALLKTDQIYLSLVRHRSTVRLWLTQSLQSTTPSTDTFYTCPAEKAAHPTEFWCSAQALLMLVEDLKLLTHVRIAYLLTQSRHVQPLTQSTLLLAVETFQPCSAVDTVHRPKCLIQFRNSSVILAEFRLVQLWYSSPFQSRLV